MSIAHKKGPLFPLFGLFVSTVLTLVVMPVVYYGVMRNRVEWIRTATG